ncbi:hypothetical protein PsYK624_006610 [Phanerochaete sordida]|uniref:Uncharacterized protein n=1 Tax=Phanerochaete sordida TaxID=48140 RepID=A0A9P3FYM9_9APHY|nr:hypothetical protein PsYK624_006610 [Phanerochaete sordida]
MPVLPPRVQPKTFILTIKTHKLTVLTTVTAPEKTTIGDLKAEALSALKADVLSSDRDGDFEMFGAPQDPEWELPPVNHVEDFEFARIKKERGERDRKFTYETLPNDAIVKQQLSNWDSLFIQFRDESGELQPVKVSLPSLVEEEDEIDHSVAKGKRKAADIPDS